jgi:hypothetical protein
MFDSIKHPRKRAFLAAYSECGIVKAAAKAAGISRELHYEWLMLDPAYVELFGKANEMAGDALEDEARRRAHLGTREVVLYQGDVVMVDGKPLYKRKYSDTLMLAMLKAHRPERFKDKTEVTGKDGAPIEIAIKFV